MVRLTEIVVGGGPEAWTKIGLRKQSAHFFVSDVAISVHGDDKGLLSCSFSHERVTDGQPPIHLIDGLPIQLHRVLSPSSLPTSDGASTLEGVEFIGIDHIVITTDDLGRTSEAIEDVLGVACARTRDAGHSVTQAFHKLDNTILELVAGPQVKHFGARWWGFVLPVNDIDSWWSQVGEGVATPPRDAVQQGRKISTIHSSVGLGIATAVMSPHVRVS